MESAYWIPGARNSVGGGGGGWWGTFLQRDGRTLVSDIVSVARVKNVGSAILPTGRTVVRLDVTPDPYNEEDLMSRSIRTTQAVWMVREENTCTDIPIVRRYKQVEHDYDWRLDAPTSSSPICTDAEEVRSNDYMPFWIRASMEVISSASAVTSSAGSVLMRRRKHLISPIVLGDIATYATWTYDDEGGLVAVAISKAVGVRDSAPTILVKVKTGLIRIGSPLLLRLVVYVIYRCFRLIDYCVRWLEPWDGPSEAGPASSSPLRGPSLAAPRNPSAVGELFSPFIVPYIVSHGTTFSDDGAGALGTSSDRNRCQDDGSSIPADTLHATTEAVCIAHTVFPDDGVHMPSTTHRRSATDAVSGLLSVGETVMENGAPQRTPGLGGSATLCHFHADAYQTRSESALRHRSNCSRRVFPWVKQGVEVITCAYRLQLILAAEAVPSEPQLKDAECAPEQKEESNDPKR